MKRKRGEDDTNSISKRTYSETAEADFSLFISPPAVPYDISIGNQSYSFQSHRIVAMKISSFFQHLLEGDQSITEIRLDDVTADSLKLLERLVYGPKEKRDIPDDISTISTELESLFRLAGKYDVKIIHSALHKKFAKDGHCFRSNQDLERFSKYKNTPCGDLFEVLKNNTIKLFPPLMKVNGYTRETLLEFEDEIIVKIARYFIDEAEHEDLPDHFWAWVTIHAITKNSAILKRFFKEEFPADLCLETYMKMLE